MRTLHNALSSALVFSLLLAAPWCARANPFPDLRPRPIPPRGPDIRTQTSVDARLDGTILQVSCSQTYTNAGDRTGEVEVLLPVPADAVVTDGLLLADGQEYPAEVLPADQARAIYEEIVRKRRDPALLELAGHGLIRLSAFPIQVGGMRTVSYRYHQSLAAPDGRCRMAFPIASLCGLDRVGPLELSLAIDGRDPLAQVYSPTHDLDVERDGPDRARLHYATDRPDPRETMEVIAVRDARDVGFDLRTASGHGEDGYFLLAVSPGWDLLTRRSKASEAVTFALDVSGSMQGEKLDQAKKALARFLDEIPREDRFELIAFSSDVTTLFADGPHAASHDAVDRARAWLDHLQAGGGTALCDAVEEACRLTPKGGLVLLLTDGQPTVGETNVERILERARDAGRSLRFHALGVGYDVSARLLDDLARQGNGSVCYVRPGEDVADAVTTLRRRVEHPCAQEVRLDVNGARVTDVFPRDPAVLFAGEPLLFAGRVPADAGRATVTLTAEAPDGRPLRESWSVDFADPALHSSAVPVLWASRKAAFLIDVMRREGNDPRTLDELRELSRRYGILNEEVALLARDKEGPPPQPLLAPTSTWGGIRKVDRGGASGPVANLQTQDFSERGGRASDIDLSAKKWQLSAAGASDELRREPGDPAGLVTAGEVTFQRDGEVWCDTRITDPLPDGTRTVRVRAYGEAYFRLAADGGRLAAWLALGERVRVLLPGILLEVAPDGEASLPDATIAKILAAAKT